MKEKDSIASTTIRSVLADVYAADKASPEQKVPSSAIMVLLRKAAARRADSALQFKEAGRDDLVRKEQQEIGVINRFLPPLLPEAEVDRILQQVLAEKPVDTGADARRALGAVLKEFYAKADRSFVDPEVVKRRAMAALSA
ncbi:GatB/YqeY domain-containing protein [Vararia minispora EC-137]|uniref:GatB/YqeY domain-containing protein n=1 Tax=Vararia minispora EC-137 TaxID=1314806 RepID=A0ACB8QYX6_9AGAM|nr:GatB/YqeY domain-containing protein [Vararia minispora EC-137]